MLSSAATSLTLLGRHLERADHLARVLGVHVSLSLDRTDEPGPEFWVRFMELAGWRRSDTGRRDEVIEMVVAGTLGPSVRASIAAASLAAQAVRPSLPTELDEQVNALHWRVAGGSRGPGPYPVLTGGPLAHPVRGGPFGGPMAPEASRGFLPPGEFPGAARHGHSV